jgi:hypothetical protein
MKKDVLHLARMAMQLGPGAGVMLRGHHSDWLDFTKDFHLLDASSIGLRKSKVGEKPAHARPH